MGPVCGLGKRVYGYRHLLQLYNCCESVLDVFMCMYVQAGVRVCIEAT
jgi:hypothetical protein